jgi:2-phosphoglycolate phosphatase
MSKKKLIIYDLDGTLVDTRKDIADAANHMLQGMKLPVLPQATIEKFVGHGVQHFIRNCIGNDQPKQIEQGLKLYRAYYHEHMLDHSQLYPGAKEVLDYFKDRFQAVITNKPDPFSLEILKGLGVADYFFHVVAGNSPFPKKPDPGSVQAIMRMKIALPEETIFIGDSPIDIETARNSGVPSVIITHGFVSRDELESAQPDLLVDHFSELLEVVRENQW